MQALGKHFLLELSGCPYELLNNKNFIRETLLCAARAANATVVSTNFHTFSPYGVSGVVVIAESHITIHTWPELGYAALDIFTCGSEAMPEAAVQYCKTAFQAKHTSSVKIVRGLVDLQNNKQARCFCSIEEGAIGHT